MRRSQSVALMIVGGAGMIVGSLIDGDTGTIIMVGGGVIGLVGLFQYLR
jgi:cystathionine beta-lyase family protein involved in aluminum resistance